MYDRDLSLTQSAVGVVVATMSACTVLQSFLFPEYIFLGMEYLVDCFTVDICNPDQFSRLLKGNPFK